MAKWDPEHNAVENAIANLNKTYDYFDGDLSREGACAHIIRSGIKVINSVIEEGAKHQSRNTLTKLANNIQAEEQKISITEMHDGLRIVIPHNIPKLSKKDTDNWQRTDYYRACLINGMRTYFQKNKIHFDKAKILIRNVYISEKELLDYDNQDYKPVLDAINVFCLSDDSPLRYTLHLSAEIGEQRMTMIYIQHQKEKPGN